MKLFVIGATGRTGRQVVQLALARGHFVTAFGRNQTLAKSERLTFVIGDPCQSRELAVAMSGHDAVVSCLGQKSASEPELVSKSAAATIQAMSAQGIRKLSIVSGGLLFPSINPLVITLRIALARRLRDAKAMERVVLASELSWVIARPPHLKEDHTNKQTYRTCIGKMPGYKWSMQFSELATFLLDSIETNRFNRNIVGVGGA
jgi:putative NADH-flavin reductase